MSGAHNPAAFPNTGNSAWSMQPTEGMTLRDWFATHAPEPPATWWDSGRLSCAGYAMWNYQYADAMLAARGAA